MASSGSRPVVIRGLSRIKFWLATALPARTYWHLMGSYKPVGAVTSQFSTLEESLASGATEVALLERLGAIRPTSSTLQVGCGIGRIELHLAPKVAKAYGADVSPAMVAHARKNVPHANADFVLTDGRSLAPWSNATLDLVYSFLVFQHMPRAQFARYLQEARRVLRPEGHLVFQIMIDESGASPEPPATHPYGLRRYTRADVESGLRDAGFLQVARYTTDGVPDDGRAEGDLIFHARVPGGPG